MTVPLARRQICEMVDTWFTLLHAFAVNFELKTVIEPEKPDVAIPAEDCRQGDMARVFEPLLESLIDAGGTRRLEAVSRVAVKMRQQPDTGLAPFAPMSLIINVTPDIEPLRSGPGVGDLSRPDGAVSRGDCIVAPV